MNEEVTTLPVEVTPTYLPHVAKGAMINMIGAISRTVLLYTYTLVLARTLSASDLGAYFLMFTIMNIMGLVATVGLDFGVVRFVSLHDGEGRYGLVRKTLSAGLLLGVACGVIAAVGVIFLAPSLKSILFEDNQEGVMALRIFAISIPFWVAARLYNASTQGLHRMQYQVYSRDMGEQFSKLTLSVGAIAMGLGIVGVVWANVASVLIALVMSMFFTYRVLPRSAGGTEEKVRLADPAKTMYRYSFPLAFSNILGMALIWADTLLMGYLGTSADVGFYGAALRVGSTFSATILLAFITVFQPVISDLCNRHQMEELRSMFKIVTRWMFFCSYPIFLLLVIFADPVMRLFGSDFSVGSGALVILAIGQLVNASTGASGMMVVMSGRSQMELVNVSVALVINTIMCFLLIPGHGVIGAAIANMSALSVINLMRMAEVWIFMRIHAYKLSDVKPFIAGTASALVLVLINRYLIVGNSIAIAAVLAVVFGVMYISMNLAMGLDDQDQIVLRLAKKRLLNMT